MRSVTLPAAIIARFRSLSLERLERLEAGWSKLVTGEVTPELAAAVRHDLHTLKGDSRVVGFNDIHLLCHKLEELLEVAHKRDYQVPEEFDLVVTMATRLMVMLLRTRDGASLGGIDVDGFVLQIDELLAEQPARAITAEAGPPTRRTLVPVEAAIDHVSPSTQQRLAISATEVFLEHLRSAGSARGRLLDVWRALSRQISAFYAVPLGPRIQRHQDAALKLSRDLGKEVTVELETGDVRVRADAADALDTAVLHMIRNAVDHGIEDPEERARAGKPAAGRIRVDVRIVEDGGEIAVEDDGRGVDLDEVRQRAVALGFLSRREADRAPESELLDLLLEPGFTTKTRVSDVSGRGIGLDAVRTALARAGGRITLVSRPGQGTTATARVPQASRRVRVHAFRAWGADLVLAVPASFEVAAAPDEAAGGLVIDPLEALDARPGARGPGWAETPDVVLEVRRGELEVQVRAGGTPYPRTAERFCPTGEEFVVEVVMLGDAEALLIRPDLLRA